MFRFARATAVTRRWLAALPDYREVIMPKVSPTMTAGRLVAWKKGEGEAFAEGEDIADVESDKATMPISAREDGYLARIFVGDDSPDIPLGQLLAITVEEEEDIAAFADYSPPAAPAASAAVAAPPAAASGAAAGEAAMATPPPTAPAAPAAATSKKEYTGPAVGPAITRLMNEFPLIDLGGITPTGPKGRILKGDVLAAVADGTAFGRAPAAPAAATAVPSSSPAPSSAPTAAAPASGSYTDVPVSSMRRAIARRLVESKTTVPHRYATATYELDGLLALRKRLNSSDGSPGVSVNDFVIRAVALALQRVPEMNATWDAGSGCAVRNSSIDVSMAVAVSGGLITPIVFGADARGLASIAGETQRLVQRARDGALDPSEYEGGSFSVSNLGMFGIGRFSAIINPPQSGILAVGSATARAVAGADGAARAATVGVATLSTDARVVEEAVAARFLKQFCMCMTDPATYMV